MADSFNTEGALAAFIDEQRKLGVPEEQIQASVRELSAAPAPSAPSAEVANDLSYVGGWARLGAAAVDFIIITLLNRAIAWPTELLLYPLYYGLDFLPIRLLFGSILGVPGILYLALTVGHSGQTLGKRMFGQRIVRADLGPLGYGRAFLRYTVGYFASGIVLGFGFLTIFFNKQKRGWHDRIAGSVVIHVR